MILQYEELFSINHFKKWAVFKVIISGTIIWQDLASYTSNVKGDYKVQAGSLMGGSQ